LLKLHGFEFDVVYTSWLQRAIETACKYITCTVFSQFLLKAI
jgi:bisphosphoglycerate-dependent phosphoglycerate mutase